MDIEWISDMKIRASVGLTGNNSMLNRDGKAMNYGSIGTCI